MDISEVKDLLAQFESSSLTEFEFEKNDFRLYMNKNEHSKKERVINKHADDGLQTSSIKEVEKKENVSTAQNIEQYSVEQLGSGESIISPIVGVVYLKPSPDQTDYKKVGDSVKKGEVVCIVEAMKLMNEITSPFDGIISEILVENEAVVEYNQPLFKVKV